MVPKNSHLHHGLLALSDAQDTHRRQAPADVIGNAVRVMQIATGEAEESGKTEDGKSKAAVVLGRKGGLARAKEMSKSRRVAIAEKRREHDGRRSLDKTGYISDILALCVRATEGWPMDRTSARAFLADQIPTREQILIPPVLRTAYAAVRATVTDNPYLQVPSAVYNRGRMVTWAVDFSIEKLIKSGQWSVDYRWRSFGSPHPTGRYIEIRFSHSLMTISQVPDPSKQPRDVAFRENARLINDPFLPFEGLEDDTKVNGLPSWLLVHGHQELNFVHIGMPHSRRHHAYIHRSVNLLDLPRAIAPTTPRVEDTTFEDTMTLKQEIDKWRMDHGG